MELYLECDCCKTTFKSKKDHPVSGLLEEAQSSGWSIVKEDEDDELPALTLCVDCSVKVVMQYIKYSNANCCSTVVAAVTGGPPPRVGEKVSIL